MTALRFLTSLLLVAVAFLSMELHAFAPSSPISKTAFRSAVGTSKPLNIFDEKEREALTRDSEPEDFFQTNTDKMSDEEKVPIAVAGLVGISLPFILGLIALYAARY